MPTRPTANAIFREARKIFGDINIINRDENDIEFSVDKFVAYNEDNTTSPVVLAMGNITDFDDKVAVSEFVFEHLHPIFLQHIYIYSIILHC